MKALRDARWIKVKGALFLVLGLLSLILFYFERPTLWEAALLLVAIWSWCRFYYFVFYVMERYIDPSYKFAGILSLVHYLVRKKRQ